MIARSYSNSYTVNIHKDERVLDAAYSWWYPSIPQSSALPPLPPSLIEWHIDVLDCSVICPLADATPDFSNNGLTALPTEQGIWLHVRTGAHTEESGHACDFRRLAPNRELACARCYGLILPVCHSSEIDTVNKANTEKCRSHNAYIFSVKSRTNTQNANRWVIVLLPGTTFVAMCFTSLVFAEHGIILPLPLTNITCEGLPELEPPPEPAAKDVSPGTVVSRLRRASSLVKKQAAITFCYTASECLKYYKTNFSGESLVAEMSNHSALGLAAFGFENLGEQS